MSIGYTPSAWQREFHSLQTHEALGAGAAGPGKTICLLMEPIIAQVRLEMARCMGDPAVAGIAPDDPLWDIVLKNKLRWGHSTGWALYLRRTSNMLKPSLVTAERLFKEIDPDVKWNGSEGIFTFRSGFRYQFGHCHKPDDWGGYLSSAFCAAEGTDVLMADGSFRAIETLKVGDEVMTLEGSRPVTATWNTGIKPCVEAVVRVHGETVGTQRFPTTHPFLAQPSEQSRPGQSPGSPRDGQRAQPHGYVWLDYESILCGRQESPAKRVSIVDEGTGFAEFGGLHRAAGQLPALSVPVVLHEPTVRSALAQGRTSTEHGARPGDEREWGWRCLGSSRPPLGTTSGHQPTGAIGQLSPTPTGLVCGGAGAQLDLGTTTDLAGRCSCDPYLRGERPPRGAETDQGSTRQQVDAEGQCLSCSGLDGSGSLPECSQSKLAGFYPHFYSGEIRARTEDVRIGEAELRYCGALQTYDLTVEGANHYITRTGMIQCQTFLCFDELVQFLEEQYEQIKTRLRAFDPVIRPFLKTRAMSNPVMRMTAADQFSVNDPYWVRRYFVDPAPEGRVVHRRVERNSKGNEVARTRIYLPAKLRDNPDPDFVQNYEAQLLHAPVHMKKALLDGDWYVTAGSYFGDVWNSNYHVIRKFSVPKEWPQFRSMDWGYKSYGAIHWWAIDEDDNLICTNEFSFRLKTATQVAREVKDIEKKMGLWGYDGSRLTGPADTQLWEKRGDSGMSKAEEMAAVGVRWVKADKASRRRNAERMMDRLSAVHFKDSRPGLALFDNCIMAIRTIPSIQRDHMNIEEPAEGGDDHWVDSCWYACAYASRGRKGVAMIRDDDDNDDGPRIEDRGQYGYGAF